MTPQQALEQRVVADLRDRSGWVTRRARSLGASDAAKFAKLESAPLYLREKLHNPFDGNAYTAHGNDRERHVLSAFGVELNTRMFGDPVQPRFVATPDGLVWRYGGELVLVQAKTVQRKWKDGQPVPAFTSAKGERQIPPTYKRQMWWEQMVTGAVRTLFVWEEHDNFRPTGLEPESCWHERDDSEIAKLREIGQTILDGMDAAEQFRRDNA